ncbi:alpha/beta fold hydrolase [Candidatus Bipolaricaulota bacterium]|nr:alpha/beta fold hydrolase [Candidatus Bipolaricaulota bacterium]
MNRKRLKIALASALVMVLLSGVGFLSINIWQKLDKTIYTQGQGVVTDDSPRYFDLPYQEVKFETDRDIIIRGWYVPSMSPDKAIILVPGFGGTRWSMLWHVPFLVDAGYNVLLFDPRSTGLSGGNRYGFGYFESIDIQHAIDFLMKGKGISEIGLLGRSAGATASLLASLRDDRVDAVVADSPYANLRFAADDFGKYSHDRLFQTLFPVYMFSARLALGVNLYRETNILNKIDELDTPAFFIHGLQDAGIGHQNSERLFKRKVQPKRIWLVPNTNHIAAFENYPGEYKQRIIDFFESYI